MFDDLHVAEVVTVQSLLLSVQTEQHCINSAEGSENDSSTRAPKTPNPHTVTTKTKHDSLQKDRLYYRTAVLDIISYRYFLWTK